MEQKIVEMSNFEQNRERFENSEIICQECKNWELQYRNHLNTAYSLSDHTKAKMYARLTRVLENETYCASKINEYHEEDRLEKINLQIISSIQNSDYKKSGQYAKRTKKDMWLSWKRAIETHSISIEDHKEWMPKVSFSSDREKVDTQADTKPGDLPNEKQMRNFLKALGAISRSNVAKRNQAFILFLWDTGARWGEARQVKLKDVEINGKELAVRVPGNKSSDDRVNHIFQGGKLLREYYQNHQGGPDDYLFCNIHEQDYSSPLSRQYMTRKLFEAKSHADLDFKLKGEPFHIFRKAMTTYYYVNDLGSWEDICNRQGKKGDSTKPDYLKLLDQDVNERIAENIGRDLGSDSRDNRMIGPMLEPRKCIECGNTSYCFYDVCSNCGTELPESDLPKGNVIDRKELDVERTKRKVLEDLHKNPDQTFAELVEKYSDK